MTPEQAQAWLEELFEFEVCHECGGDAADHDVYLGPFGLPFARCKRENVRFLANRARCLPSMGRQT